MENEESLENEENLEIEETFVLVFHTLIKCCFLGGLLSYFEKCGLTIKGMKYSSVDKKFAEKHFSRPRRIPSKETMIPRDDDGEYHRDRQFWVDYLLQDPAVALLLKGKNAVKIAYRYSLSEREARFGELPIQISGGFYSSPTVQIAREDAGFWFPKDDYGKWLKRYEKKVMIFVFRNKLLGQVENFGLANTDLRDDYWQNLYYEDNQSFVLIKPHAFRVGLVGDIIEALEINSGGLIGLKLVRAKGLKSIPQNADSVDSSSFEIFVEDDDGLCGAAMVVDCLKTERISVTDDGDNHFKFDLETRVVEIDRDLIYISKPGESAWNLMERCFHFGFVVFPKRVAILEASMVGL